MKVATFGLAIEPGKKKYVCEEFNKLVDKFAPGKVSPYIIEFIGDDLINCDVTAFNLARKFDFVFFDLEKVDKRLERCGDGEERRALLKFQRLLEGEQLLCDCQLSEQEKGLARLLQLITYKPSLGIEAVPDDLIRRILDKAEIIIFFTAGKKEVRAWDIPKGSTALDAAGRIHSDLARGFIRAEVVNCRHLDSFFNMAEARAKGLVTSCGRDYVMEDGDIIEVKFNV